MSAPTCPMCHLPIHEKGKLFRGQRYHAHCLAQRKQQARAHDAQTAQANADTELASLRETILSCFSLKEMTPLLNMQVDKLHTQGVSYEEMRRALEYWYDTLGHVYDPSARAPTLGIIPYILREVRELMALPAEVQAQNPTVAPETKARTVYITPPDGACELGYTMADL